MRAIVMSEHGGPEVLRLVERPVPAPGPGEALVRVAAVAVNRLDIWVREDVGHAYGAVLPVIPGYDVAGEVVAVGEGVADVAPGMRVYVHYDFSLAGALPVLPGGRRGGVRRVRRHGREPRRRVRRADRRAGPEPVRARRRALATIDTGRRGGVGRS